MSNKSSEVRERLTQIFGESHVMRSARPHRVHAADTRQLRRQARELVIVFRPTLRSVRIYDWAVANAGHRIVEDIRVVQCPTALHDARHAPVLDSPEPTLCIYITSRTPRNISSQREVFGRAGAWDRVQLDLGGLLMTHEELKLFVRIIDIMYVNDRNLMSLRRIKQNLIENPTEVHNP